MKKITKLFFVFFIIISMTFFGCTSTPAPSDTSDQAISENQANEETYDSKEDSSDVLDNLANLFAKSENFMEKGLSYTQTVTMGTETTTMRIWIKGELYKTETTMDGIEVVSINDFENEEFITYYPQEKSGVRFISSFDESMFDEDYLDADGFEDQVDTENYEFVGRETINGERCYVVITRDLETLETVKMWVSEKYGIPMRIEVKDVEYGEDYILEVRDISEGVSDREFEVPSDIIIQTIG